MTATQCLYPSYEDNEPLKRKLNYMLKNSCDVEDVLQDAYVRLIEFQSNDDSIENVPAFFHRVAHNIAIDRVRRRSRTDRIFVASDDSDDISAQTLMIHCSQPNAEDSLQNRQALDAVVAAVSELPAKCARAYLLSCVDELSHAEIAREIGATVSMIEKYIARARRHIRETIAPTYRLNS
jgi:RNA polymerase sigma-70 factor (ECF subfamily)